MAVETTFICDRCGKRLLRESSLPPSSWRRVVFYKGGVVQIGEALLCDGCTDELETWLNPEAQQG